MIKPESTGRMAAQHRGDFGGAVADLAAQRLSSASMAARSQSPALMAAIMRLNLARRGLLMLRKVAVPNRRQL
jgi:hypothetical protein